MGKQAHEKKLPFGGAELPRLRVLPVILFSVLCVLVFVLAAPAPVRMDPENPADIAFVFIRLSMLLCSAVTAPPALSFLPPLCCVRTPTPPAMKPNSQSCVQQERWACPFLVSAVAIRF